MLRRSLLSQVFRFCQKGEVSEKPSSFLTEEEKKFHETPIHLRPYDKQKYEVPMKKIKKNSGYAFIQIEPFPRARIMKICYNILAEMRKGFKEDEVYRIFTEQKVKYIMDVVDKEEDVEKMQKLLGVESIELFIQSLSFEFQSIDVIRAELKRLSQLSQEEKMEGQGQLFENFSKDQGQKYPAYKHPERKKQNIF